MTKTPCGVWLPSWLGLQWSLSWPSWDLQSGCCAGTVPRSREQPWQDVGAETELRAGLVPVLGQPGEPSSQHHTQAQLMGTARGVSKRFLDFRSEELFFWKKWGCFPRGVCCFHYFLQRKLLREKDVGIVWCLTLAALHLYLQGAFLSRHMVMPAFC